RSPASTLSPYTTLFRSQRFDTKVLLPGYTGAADGTSGSPTVATYIQGLNSPAPTVTSVSSTANGGGFFNTPGGGPPPLPLFAAPDRKSTRLNSSHSQIS